MAQFAKRCRLGPSIEVSRIAWGMWRFGRDSLAASRKLVEVALECEIDFFDTADIYGEIVGQSEEMLGRILAQTPALRQRMVIATKGGIDDTAPYDSSPPYLEAACERSLRRLGVDTIDLYQIHRPDLLSHPEHLAAALTKLVRAGKVYAYGVDRLVMTATGGAI